MTERCFVKVEFDPAPPGRQVRRSVGGFLRYIQHRDLHPTPRVATPKPDVAGMVKYVAYRDKASSRAELFGPPGSLATQGRKDFVGFVARSIEGSQPQIFRTRAGALMDRRRAVSRFLLSPESAEGLNLERLARVAVSQLESDLGLSGIRWIAAIHRNTAHHHVHLVLAGMHGSLSGGFQRVDISEARLASMKLAIGLEIERQRGERAPSRLATLPAASAITCRESNQLPALTPQLPVARPPFVRALRLAELARHTAHRAKRTNYRRSAQVGKSMWALRAVARRYQRRMEHELEIEARRLGRERAA